jgi:hypothetical protein
LSRVDTGEKLEVHDLVLIDETSDMMRCCNLVSSGQGLVRRFCLQPIILGWNGCGTRSHWAKIAVPARQHGYVTVVIQGGMQTGSLDKRLRVNEVLKEDELYFNTKKLIAR